MLARVGGQLQPGSGSGQLGWWGWVRGSGLGWLLVWGMCWVQANTDVWWVVLGVWWMSPYGPLWLWWVSISSGVDWRCHCQSALLVQPVAWQPWVVVPSGLV